MFKKAVFAAIFCTLGVTGHAGTSVSLGPGAVLTGGEYTTGGGLTVAMEAREIGGKLGLCGVWSESTSMSVYTRNAASRVLAKGAATLNDEVVARDFRFLNRVRPAPSYAGAPANCIVIDRAWQAQDTQAVLQLRIPRQKIFLTSSDRNTGPRVFFKRSDSTNPALKQGSFLPPSVTSFSSHKTQ